MSVPRSYSLSFAYFQLLTDNVSYSLGNAGKKKEVVVRAVALLAALTKEYNMHIIQC